MASPRNRKKIETTSTLFEALQFVAIAQEKHGTVYQSHCILNQGWAIAFNGVVSVGMETGADLVACPHTLNLVAALGRCGANFQVVQKDDKSLSIIKPPFNATVECVPFTEVQSVRPDPQIAILTDAFLDGLRAVSFLAKEGERGPFAACILRSCSVAATNGRIVLEYWHGIDMPALMLPKASVTALLSAGKSVTGFGVSNVTITFYFSDGSWLRSQLIDEQPPNIDGILDPQSTQYPVPKTFFEGVEAIEPFCDASGTVIFENGVIRTHKDDSKGARYEVAGVPTGPLFNARLLQQIQPYVGTIDFIGENGLARFFSADQKIRGVLAGMLPPDTREVSSYVRSEDNVSGAELAAHLRGKPLTAWERFETRSKYDSSEFDPEIPF